MVSQGKQTSGVILLVRREEYTSLFSTTKSNMKFSLQPKQPHSVQTEQLANGVDTPRLEFVISVDVLSNSFFYVYENCLKS